MSMHKLATTTPKSEPEFLNDFFRDLKTCYPSWRAQLKSRLEVNKFKQQWLKAFAENGVDTPEKLELGLEMARKDDSSWLPAVGQFITWCKPTAERLGLPDVHTAYREACLHQEDDEWSCSLVYFAQLNIRFELRTFPQGKSFPLFERMYNAVLDRIINGEQLSAPKPLPPPDKVSRRNNPKKVTKIIDGIFSDMGWTR